MSMPTTESTASTDRLERAARLAVEQLRGCIGLTASEGQRIGQARDELLTALARLDAERERVRP